MSRLPSKQLQQADNTKGRASAVALSRSPATRLSGSPGAKYIRSERSVILINFCLSIISSNALILIGQTQTRNKVICTLVAAFLHFFFLSSFCWVLTEAWQSYMAVTGRLRNRIIRKRFLCLGWGEDLWLALVRHDGAVIQMNDFVGRNQNVIPNESQQIP
uniref:Uncharacterized protein n=1 Tax=Sphaerodactylus townsendi TaxID=933632 RepID=A0ACB8FE40_9SAUR